MNDSQILISRTEAMRLEAVRCSDGGVGLHGGVGNIKTAEGRKKMRFKIVVSISIMDDGCQQWEGIHIERPMSASSVGLLFAAEAWAEFLKKLSEIPNTLPPAD